MTTVEPSDTAIGGSADAPGNNPPNFLFIRRPPWDVDAEKYDFEAEVDGKKQQKIDQASPDWPWTITEQGSSVYKNLEKQARKRDQEAHGRHFYNDFTAHGIHEVVENGLKDFDKAVSQRPVSPYDVWPNSKAVRCFFAWTMWTNAGSKSITVGNTATPIVLIGKALLTGLSILNDHDLARPYQPGNGRLRSLSTILALFLEFAKSWIDIGGDQFGETNWMSKVAKLARENGIEMKGPYKLQERYLDLLNFAKSDDEEFSGSEEEPIIIDNGDYSIKGGKETFKLYTKRHAVHGRKTIGGTNYVIRRGMEMHSVW